MGIKRKLKQIINQLFGDINKNTVPPYLIQNGDLLTVGLETYHNGNFVTRGAGRIKIGSYCAIGKNVTLIKTNHNYNYASIQYTFYRKNFDKIPYSQINKDYVSITIGNDVWIGDNVIILPNVIIGNGACIGAGSVVTKNVSPYTIVAGVPAREINKRFNDEIINYLEDIKWWNLSSKELKKIKPLFFTDLNLIDSIKQVTDQYE